MGHKPIRTKWHVFQECIREKRVILSLGKTLFMPRPSHWHPEKLDAFLDTMSKIPMPHYVLSDSVRDIVRSVETYQTICLLKKFDRNRFPAPVCMVEYDDAEIQSRMFCFAFENSHRSHIIGSDQAAPEVPFSLCAFALIDFSDPYHKKNVTIREHMTGRRLEAKNPLFAVLFPMCADIDNVTAPLNDPSLPYIGKKPNESLGAIAYKTFPTPWAPWDRIPETQFMKKPLENHMAIEIALAGAYATRALVSLMRTRGLDLDRTEKPDLEKLNKKRQQNRKTAIPSHTFVSIKGCCAAAKASIKGEPTGYKQPFHMRSAHSKIQHYGPNNSLTKEIFVEAYVAGYESDDNNVKPRIVTR